LTAPREYELVLMLDPGQDAPARDALAQEARGQIEAGGTLKHENAWGLRKLAFEIEQRNEADYRWFRFEGSNDLLERLDHNLKIADGVLRFRIFKVDPAAPVMAPPATTAPPPRDRADDGDKGAPEPAAVVATSPPAEPESAPESSPDSSADTAE
jgi:small subunit ribosomal protein S6